MEKCLNIIKYLILAILQGITEVLPISSSGHLQIVSNLLNINTNSITLNVFLHLASLFAVIIFLKNELFSLIKGVIMFIFFRKKEYKLEFKLCIYLVISTLILVIFTLIIKSLGFKDSPLWLVGICLILNGFLLFCFCKFKGNRTLKSCNLKDAIIIGMFQCIGSFPGISRSGSCLCGCQLRKFNEKSSANYSFLLFVPTVIGATVLELSKLRYELIEKNNFILYLISFIITFITTFYAFSLLRKIYNRGGISYFSIYCVIIGILTFIYAVKMKK